VLKVGDKAPTISLSGDDGKTHDVKSEGRTIVVYFYPKDDTPGCTVEAKDFSSDEAQARLERASVTVYGISKDTVQSHAKFRDKHGLHVRLLSDPELKVHTAFGAYGEKTMYGRKVMGTIRSTFVLRDGHVTHAYPSVKVPGHVEAVLTAVEGGASVAKTPAKAPAKNKAAEGAPTSKKPASKKPAAKPASKKPASTKA
jgi:thioredoxin-dependent peroxiredoxin